MLVQAGKPQKQTAADLGIHPVTLSKWIKQDVIDRRARPGVPSKKLTEQRAAHRRIRELETELAIVRQGSAFLGEDKLRPIRIYPVIDRLIDAGHPSTAAASFSAWRVKVTTSKDQPLPTQLSRQWLTGLISDPCRLRRHLRVPTHPHRANTTVVDRVH